MHQQQNTTLCLHCKATLGTVMNFEMSPLETKILSKRLGFTPKLKKLDTTWGLFRDTYLESIRVSKCK